MSRKTRKRTGLTGLTGIRIFKEKNWTISRLSIVHFCKKGRKYEETLEFSPEKLDCFWTADQVGETLISRIRRFWFGSAFAKAMAPQAKRDFSGSPTPRLQRTGLSVFRFLTRRREAAKKNKGSALPGKPALTNIYRRGHHQRRPLRLSQNIGSPVQAGAQFENRQTGYRCQCKII